MIPAQRLAVIRAAVNRGEGITQLSALQLLDEIDRLTFLWRNTPAPVTPGEGRRIVEGIARAQTLILEQAGLIDALKRQLNGGK